MPSITIRVRAVYPRSVGRSTVQKFDVVPQLEPGQLGAPLYETFDAFKASLCARAAERGFPVCIVWKDSRYGREIVAVRIANESEAA